MNTKSTLRFAVLCALLCASAPAFAQAKDTRAGGTGKEVQRRESGQNKSRDGHSNSSSKSEGRGDGSAKGRKARR